MYQLLIWQTSSPAHSGLAGCAFVQYSKWAACEQAIENHNGKTRLGNSEVPLVVKFADAKRKQPAMGYREGWMGDKQLMGRLAAEQAAYGYQASSSD